MKSFVFKVSGSTTKSGAPRIRGTLDVTHLCKKQYPKFEASTWTKYNVVANYPKSCLDIIKEDNKRDQKEKRITISLAMIPGDISSYGEDTSLVLTHFQYLFDMKKKLSKKIIQVYYEAFYYLVN